MRYRCRVWTTMIGQQKRSLEHSVSTQPTKYQKHCDDNFCETSTRVASLAGEELFAGVQSKYAKYATSPATGFHSTRSSDKAVAHDLSDQPRRLNILSGVNQGVKSNSCHELDSLSDPAAVSEALESADFTCTEIFCEGKAENHKESRAFSAHLSNHAEDQVHSVHLFPAHNSERARLHSAEDSNASHGKRTESEMLLKDPLNEASSQPGGTQWRGICQKDEGPSTTNIIQMGVEADHAFLECVRKSVESRRPNGSRPFPVFLRGKVINLYLLSEQVKAHGGYQNVTSEGLWGKISQTLGFVPECGPGVKLIYFKYLKGLEGETNQSLEPQPAATSLDVAQARTGDFAIGSRMDDEKGEKFSPLTGERFFENEPCLEKSERRTMNVDDSQEKGGSHHFRDHFEEQTEKHIRGKERETGKPHSYYKDGGDKDYHKVQGGYDQFGNCTSNTGSQSIQAQSADCNLPKMHAKMNGLKTSKREFGREDGKSGEESGRAVTNLLGRSHQPLTSTLIRIRRMALDPGNPYMGAGIEGADQNEEWVKECASQAEKIRGLFWKRKDEMRSGEPHLHQAKQLPIPSHYYEEVPRPDQQSVERFRATRERVAQHGYPGSAGLHRSLHESSRYLQRGSSPQSQGHRSSHRVTRQSSFHSSYTETAYPDYRFTDRPRKRIPIGPDFQAQVPPRRTVATKSACEMAKTLGDETQSSDEDDAESWRWFGKQVWPPPGFKSIFPDIPVGVGRALTCACLDPESMDCVRIHVQEERVRLERELGQAFYIWKFDEMGESVSDRWTKEEERTFRALVKMNPPSLDKNFWNQLPDAFPGKKMKELVSYYFNVFVLRRRAIQNRVDGRQVDSDDDGTELPEVDSDDSEEYDSGEEPDEDAEEDASDAEDETQEQNYSFGGGRSGKHIEHSGFCDLAGVNLLYYSTNMDTMDTKEGAHCVSVDICSPSGSNLDNEVQDLRSSRQEGRDVRLDCAQLTSRWSHEQDEEKHLGARVMLVGDEELQEVKTWEDPHWDEADHDQDNLEEDAVVSLTFLGKADQRELSPSGNTLGDKRTGVGDHQRITLTSCEREVWAGALHNAPRNEGDKLLSTNGMIQELFGDESPEASSPS